MRRAQSRWGFQRGEAAALPFGRTRGFKPRVRYNLIISSNLNPAVRCLSEKAYTAQVKLDLRNAATAQEAYLVDTNDYSDTLSGLKSGVIVRMLM